MYPNTIDSIINGIAHSSIGKPGGGGGVDGGGGGGAAKVVLVINKHSNKNIKNLLMIALIGRKSIKKI